MASHTTRTDGSVPDRYALIGNPVGHTLSPMIHREFASATGQHIEYTTILGPLGGFAKTVDAFRALGGRGLNITLPFKLDAYAYASERSARAELGGAVNAIKFDGERTLGENFDGVGLVRDVRHNLGFALGGKRVLVLGAGGAARGALLPLVAEVPGELVIASIEVGMAMTLAEIGNRQADARTAVRGTDYRGLAGTRFDVVFNANATSASLSGELPPVPVTVFGQCQLAYDLAYGLELTPFLRLARNAGVPHVADGVGMLVEQAAEAFAWWRGVRPHTATIIERLRVPLD